MGKKSDMYSQDGGSQMDQSVISQGVRSRRGIATKNETRGNIPQMRDRKQRAATRHRDGNDGDFEKMFGKNIDKYLEESDWDIDSHEQMSQYSRGTGRNSARGHKLKHMEKAYLQRIETNTQDAVSKKTYGRKTQGTSVTGPTRKTEVSKKPPAFREFQDRFVDQPDFVHRGEVLEFDTHMDAGKTSSQKKNQTSQQFRDGPAGMNSSFNSQ